MAQQMKLPFFDVSRQVEPLKGEIMKRFEELVSQQSFVMGPAVLDFEKQLAEWMGVKHVIAVASGTDALIVALKAMGVGVGDEVVTTPFSFFASTSSICSIGAKPVFVDIEPETFNIDSSRIEAAITSKTKAIMPVHLYGQCADMDPIMKISQKTGVPVLEDFAQSIGAEYKGKSAGSIGHIGGTSFYPTKNLGGAGEGGAVTTNDDELAERTRMIRVHGGSKRYVHSILGMNSRLDSLQCAYLSIKLPHLRQWMKNRDRIAERYQTELAPLAAKGLVLPKVAEGRKHVWNQFVIRVPNRDEVRQRLTELGIPTDIYYPATIPSQEAMRGLVEPNGWPLAEKAANEVLAIPVFPELRDEEQTLVIEGLKAVL